MTARQAWRFVFAAALMSASARYAEAVPLGTAFAYQGLLKQGGLPANATCDFQFGVYDALSAGTAIGSTQTVSAVSVTNGTFSVQLDFGPSAFMGDARWLQIAARCPAGSGSYATLSPRSPITATPYALSGALSAARASDVTCTGCVASTDLADGAVTDQKVAGGIAYNKLSGAPTALPPNGPAGGALAGSYPNPGLAGNSVATAQLQNAAVTPAKINPSGAAPGQALVWTGSTVAWGTASNLSLPFAASVVTGSDAFSISNTGGGTGVSVASNATTLSVTSNNGIGVYSSAEAQTGNTSGVFGQSLSPNGVGVAGQSPNEGVQGSGGDVGVHAISNAGNAVTAENSSDIHATVAAFNRATSGVAYGIYGETDSNDFAAAGVHGVANSSSGQVVGVEGIANNSPIGTGVVGRGQAVGGYFENNAGNNSAIVSVNHSPTGTTAYGAYGETNSAYNGVAGVHGVATSGSGQVIGVEGIATNSPIGTGVVGRGAATGGYFQGDTTGVHGFSPNGSSSARNHAYGITSDPCGR